MITNKIILIIISVTAFIVIPIQAITTFILGLLVNLTFGLLLIPLNFVWTILFLGPLLALSYIYEKVTILRPFVAIIGIPLAVIGNIYVALIPSMGKIESRYEKMILCQTFPYTWKYIQFKNDKININKNDVLNKILKEVSKANPLREYLDKLKIEVYARPDYIKGKCEIDW